MPSKALRFGVVAYDEHIVRGGGAEVMEGREHVGELTQAFTYKA